jgi:hypothetical protein
MLRFRVHRARFVKSPVEYYFLNVTNLSQNRVVEVTHIWQQFPEESKTLE